MSCNNWERGTIILPKAAWASFRKSMIEAWNAEQEQAFAIAERAREVIEAQAKGKRGFDRHEAVRSFARTQSGYRSEYAGDAETLEERLLDLLGCESDRYVDGQWIKAERTKKLSAPKRKLLKLLPISRGATLQVGEATIHLDDATHSVSYSSGENNRAVERANEMKMVRTLFSKLNAIEWTRGSGGTTTGNDEYNEDSSDDEGRGGNYTIRRFGPLGKER